MPDDIGYCPKCGGTLAALTIAAKGYCELHGWVFADWTPTRPKPQSHSLYTDAYREAWG